MKHEACFYELLDCAEVAGQTAGDRAARLGSPVCCATAPDEFADVPELRRAWQSAYFAAWKAVGVKF